MRFSASVCAKDKERSTFFLKDKRGDITYWFRNLKRFNQVLYMIGDMNHSSFFTWMRQITGTFDHWVDIQPNQISPLLHSFNQYVELTLCLPNQKDLVCSRIEYQESLAKEFFGMCLPPPVQKHLYQERDARKQLAINFFGMCHLKLFPLTFPRKKITSQFLLGFVGMIIRRMTHSDNVLKTAWKRLFAIIFHRLLKV